MTEPTEPPSAAASLNSLVLSIAAAALAYMGHNVIPGAEKTEKNLELARQSIDTLVMLRTKTENNRTAEESKLIEELLFQLQSTFVKA
jgi:uncharacterized protein YjaG (DUF416 family)